MPYMMSADNLPWAAGLYAKHPQVLGVHIWDGGDLSPLIPVLTEYSLQHYFAIPKPSRSALMCAATPLTPAVGMRTPVGIRTREALCRMVSGEEGDAPPAEP